MKALSTKINISWGLKPVNRLPARCSLSIALVSFAGERIYIILLPELVSSSEEIAIGIRRFVVHVVVINALGIRISDLRLRVTVFLTT
jgi:hypothetical protein